jgi:hypothetical protein
LDWTTFEERVGSSIASTEALDGSPAVHLIVEPGGRRIGARFFTEDRLRIPSPLEEIMIRQIGVGDQTALEITTGNRALFRDFYILCCAIADRVQLDGHPISRAVGETLSSWAALIGTKALLSTAEQIGLIGELIFLNRIAGDLGWTIAAESWFGPCAEEHDFALRGADFEVKTTASENRVHSVSSLTQLAPKDKRPLYLISIQLTEVAPGTACYSLPGMVAQTMLSVTKHSPHNADRVHALLRRLRWSDDDADNYRTAYVLRTPLLAAEVRKSFPALVPSVLQHLGADIVSRFEHVNYRINVDGLGFLDGSRQFKKLLAAGAGK